MPRKPGESTMNYLARTLKTVGLNDMARRAELGHFDDYFCPPEVDDGMNINRLVNELSSAAKVQPTTAQRDQIAAVVDMAMSGEFDGTREESERWAKSKDGQETMKEFHNVFEENKET